MLKCKEVSQLVGAEMDSAGFWRRMEVRLHLMMCDRCSAYARQLRILQNASQRFVEQLAGDSRSLAALEEKIIVQHARQ